MREAVKKHKMLIVDGNNLLFQMFYGIPTKIYNKRGRTIHATIGFVSAIQRMIKTYAIDRCVVVFDCDSSQERKEILEDYKGNRPQDWETLPMDEVPFFEEEYIRECLAYLNITTLDSCGMEADDLIASIALKEERENEVYIASFDSDFFQLINENVSVIRYRGKHTKVVDLVTFMQEFSFPPNRYVLFKSLTGDTSDNVHGVPAIGKKRATELVCVYPDIEALSMGNLDFLPQKARESLYSSLEIVRRNIRLIMLEEKPIEKYCACFNAERILETNSQVLSACRIFD